MNRDAERRQTPAGPAAAKGDAKRPSRLPGKTGNTVVMLTLASVVVAVLIRVDLLSPLLFAGAVFPSFYVALKANDHRTGVALVFRWGLALFVSLLVVGVFVPDRLGASLPLSREVLRTVEAWIRDPAATPPGDTGYLLWGMLAFLVASVASGGLLGFIIGAVGLGGAAYGALFICRHGVNVVLIALVALPVWQLCLFIAGAFLLVPTSVFVFERFFHIERHPEDWTHLRRHMYVGAGFFALSVLLRYAAAPLWRTLVERWTVF